MNTVIEQMLHKYDSKNIYDQKNAMKEVMQEIVLYGLSRSGFFKEVAFYGGTALRIFYGLDRFSEDLDFSLMLETFYTPCRSKVPLKSILQKRRLFLTKRSLFSIYGRKQANHPKHSVIDEDGVIEIDC